MVLSGVLRVLLHSLNCNQSEGVLQNIFATQRSIVYKVRLKSDAMSKLFLPHSFYSVNYSGHS